MSSKQRPTSSSGSGGDLHHAIIDERKRKRMISNRESARRSRMRKQKQLEDLIDMVSQLQNLIDHLTQSINTTTQRYTEIESANNVLRAQAMELTDRLRSLNSVLHIVQEASGMALEIPDIPDPPLLNPWLVPCPLQQPIVASTEMFQY